jgi:hypothetical protein
MNFEQRRDDLIRFIMKWLDKYLSDPKQEKYTGQYITFGHDLNAYHSKYFHKDAIDNLHNIVPIIMKYWQGDGGDLIKWLSNRMKDQPSHTGVNRDLWYGLWDVMKQLKPKS